ncbi:MAG: carbohydrate kinase family protein [Fibrella sp.]|nr:carbohydrate kinase family protein [Armatimonadota bacterium]
MGTEPTAMNQTDWRTRRVAGIGIVGLDHVAVTDRWERDTKSTATHYFEQVGGPVPVALMAMARLGLDELPLIAGSVGEDGAGEKVHWLLSGDVDTSLVYLYFYNCSTPHSIVVLNMSDGTRTLTNWNDSSLPTLTREQIGGMRGCGLLHVDGRDITAILETVSLLREYETIVSLDLGSFREEKARLFPECDIIIASKVASSGAFPGCPDDPIEQAKRFLAHGATVAGVTLGADGVVIGCRDENGGEPVHLPAFNVENVVDTCGAGDLFHGAFLWAYREGKSVIESATFAQAAVALRIQCYGNVAGQPTREQVESFLAQQ